MRKGLKWIGFSVALLTAGCGDEKASTGSLTNAAAATTVPAAAPVSTKPGAGSAGEPGDAGLVVSGPIIVEHQVELSAQRDGELLKIYFDAPARVKAGTLLAKLDDRQILANLEAARAK